MRRSILTLLLVLLMPALAWAMPGKKTSTPAQQPAIQTTKLHAVAVPGQAVVKPRVIQSPTLTLKAPKPRIVSSRTPTALEKLQTRTSARTVRLVRERPVFAPHALRSLGLQLELHLMQETVR